MEKRFEMDFREERKSERIIGSEHLKVGLGGRRSLRGTPEWPGVRLCKLEAEFLCQKECKRSPMK